jgi:hypothetical protein
MQPANQQFVDIQAAKQGGSASRRGRGYLVGGRQGAQFSAQVPAQQQGAEWLQQAFPAGTGAAGTACHQAQSTMIPGKHFQQKTGFTVRTAMQDVRRFQGYPLHGSSLDFIESQLS